MIDQRELIINQSDLDRWVNNYISSITEPSELYITKELLAIYKKIEYSVNKYILTPSPISSTLLPEVTTYPPEEGENLTIREEVIGSKFYSIFGCGWSTICIFNKLGEQYLKNLGISIKYKSHLLVILANLTPEFKELHNFRNLLGDHELKSAGYKYNPDTHEIEGLVSRYKPKDIEVSKYE